MGVRLALVGCVVVVLETANTIECQISDPKWADRGLLTSEKHML